MTDVSRSAGDLPGREVFRRSAFVPGTAGYFAWGRFRYFRLGAQAEALLAIPAGLEPATRGVEIRYSIQLSYGTV